ncbi:hypothetical protein RN001_010133 [Aquatica leii]|uniref:LITAF domain-containing protein n=1 Tax=Aquatica leii TaxID=1421715 RepID=A0AAN7PW23_9COLE|nr:hypothetical protein RN001_010133 [Aquatica leii]
MNKQHNSYETIRSSGESNVETEIEHVILSASNENIQILNTELRDGTSICNTSNNATEINEPNSSGSANPNVSAVVNIESNNQHNKTTKIDKSVIDIILQHTLHRPKNILLNLETENSVEHTPTEQLKHTTNFHRITRSSRAVVCAETVSSGSSSEDSITLNARIVNNRENEIRNPPAAINRRLQGVASDSNIIVLCRTPSVRDLVHTRSQTRLDTIGAVELTRVRDEDVTSQEPVHRDINRVPLEVVPEASRNSSISSRSTVRESRILRYYRSIRSSINPDRGINTSIAQQTSPQSYNITPPLTEAPPTYSAVIRDDDMDDTIIFLNRNVVGVQQSPPFLAPRPPPTYTEAEGFNIERPMFLASSNLISLLTFTVEQLVWGPEPTYIVCPRCAHLILTSTHTRISSVNHISAIILCLCGCWPCCFIPYCVDSCKNTYHYCPNCSLFLGVYRPW